MKKIDSIATQLQKEFKDAPTDRRTLEAMTRRAVELLRLQKDIDADEVVVRPSYAKDGHVVFEIHGDRGSKTLERLKGMGARIG